MAVVLGDGFGSTILANPLVLGHSYTIEEHLALDPTDGYTLEWYVDGTLMGTDGASGHGPTVPGNLVFEWGDAFRSDSDDSSAIYTLSGYQIGSSRGASDLLSGDDPPTVPPYGVVTDPTGMGFSGSTTVTLLSSPAAQFTLWGNTNTDIWITFTFETGTNNVTSYSIMAGVQLPSPYGFSTPGQLSAFSTGPSSGVHIWHRF